MGMTCPCGHEMELIEAETLTYRCPHCFRTDTDWKCRCFVCGTIIEGKSSRFLLVGEVGHRDFCSINCMSNYKANAQAYENSARRRYKAALSDEYLHMKRVWVNSFRDGPDSPLRAAALSYLCELRKILDRINYLENEMALKDAERILTDNNIDAPSENGFSNKEVKK